MPVDETTLAKFRAFADAIRTSNPLDQPPTTHNAANWINTLQGPNAAAPLGQCIEYLQGRHPDEGGVVSINRADILDAVEGNLLPPQARFLLIMMWGHKNYGPARCLRYFQSPTISAPDRYEHVVDLIHQGHLHEAFLALSAVPGLKTSFVTKVLYFESRMIERYAPILDDRVAQGLLKLTSPWGHGFLEVSVVRPRQDEQSIEAAWAKFQNYSNGCHEIAEALDTSADNVEYFLFLCGRPFKLGILAYGSLMSNPGHDIEPLIFTKLGIRTPFPVAFGRLSKGRGGAPTLVPLESGDLVPARILVLKSSVGINKTRNILWNRERHQVGSRKRYRHGEGADSVLIKMNENDPRVEKLLYVDFHDSGKTAPQNPTMLAAAAIESVGRTEQGKDGISYLNDIVEAGIQTPQTEEYVNEILRSTGTPSLIEALAETRRRLGLEA